MWKTGRAAIKECPEELENRIETSWWLIPPLG
jgi:hypothetical protein